MRETEKTYVGCVTLTLELFPGGRGEGIYKIFYPLVFQEVAQLMNYGWIKIQSWT